MHSLDLTTSPWPHDTLQPVHSDHDVQPSAGKGCVVVVVVVVVVVEVVVVVVEETLGSDELSSFPVRPTLRPIVSATTLTPAKAAMNRLRRFSLKNFILLQFVVTALILAPLFNYWGSQQGHFLVQI